MKNLLTFLSLMFTATVFAGNLSPLTHGLIYDTEKLISNQISLDRSLPAEFTHKYALQYRDGRWKAGVLAEMKSSEAVSNLSRAEFVQVSSIIDNMVSFAIDIEYIHLLKEMDGIIYAETGNTFGPLLKHSVPDVRADSTHKGYDLPMPFYGKDVIVAILDWGFDYTHPNFYDTLMQHYRVVRAWDQNKSSSNPPAGFGYGKEMTTQQEMLAELHDIPFWDESNSSHGTHVGGIAAGGGAGTDYRGVAPVSDLVLISLWQSPAGFADAVAYVEEYAASVGKPFVINMSFGGHLGPHDGNDLLNKVVDKVAGQGKVFVGSMGNNGSAANRFHLYHDFTEGQDTIKTLAGFLTAVSNSVGQVVSIWAEEGQSFSLSFAFPGATGQILAESPWYSTNQNQTTIIKDTLYHNNDSLAYRITLSPSGLSNKPYMLVEMIKPVRNNITLQIASTDARLHAWNVLKLKTYIGNTGWTFSHSHGSGNAFSGYIGGDNTFGTTEPSGSGRNIITTGAYTAKRYIESTDTWVQGDIANFSSIGPTTDYRTKPDITAPGRNVVSALSSYQDGLIPMFFTESVDFNGRIYPFQDLSGTSMSAPVVTGVVALMLEANPSLSAQQVKSIIKETAYHDQFTDSLSMTSGSHQWGWGKVNAYQAVLSALQVVSSNEELPLKNEASSVLLYPNPATNTFYLMKESPLQAEKDVLIYDVTGRKVAKYLWGANGQAYERFVLPQLTPGNYYIVLQNADKREVLRLSVFH